MDLNTTKVRRFVIVVWCRFQSPLEIVFFEAFLPDFGLLELDWEPFGQQDLNMCDKVAKMTSTLRLLWGRLGTQSRAPRGSGPPEVAPDRAAGGVRTGILRSFGRLHCKSRYFLKCMKNFRKTKVFEGSERVHAPKLEPLGPQSRAREESGQPK